MAKITMYSTTWCPDCRRAKDFLQRRGIEFDEVNIEEDPDGEDIVIAANDGKRRVPTIKVDNRFFACSPFNAQQLADELQIPLNPEKKN
ncbi:MAG TPA: glutaredoxin domain-containing protein [Candidatus Acidoferrum sp.]|nr:glutaredoxin domain-containing protein [Candidatus Acidoferrum sp.]